MRLRETKLLKNHFIRPYRSLPVVLRKNGLFIMFLPSQSNEIEDRFDYDGSLKSYQIMLLWKVLGLTTRCCNAVDLL